MAVHIVHDLCRYHLSFRSELLLDRSRCSTGMLIVTVGFLLEAVVFSFMQKYLLQTNLCNQIQLSKVTLLAYEATAALHPTAVTREVWSLKPKDATRHRSHVRACVQHNSHIKKNALNFKQ